MGNRPRAAEQGHREIIAQFISNPKEHSTYDSIHWPEVDEDIDLEALLIGGRSCESVDSISRWLQARHRKEIENGE